MSAAISRPARYASYFVWFFVNGNAIVNACSSTTPCADSSKIHAPHRVPLDDPSRNRAQGNSSSFFSSLVGVISAMKPTKYWTLSACLD